MAGFIRKNTNSRSGTIPVTEPMVQVIPADEISTAETPITESAVVESEVYGDGFVETRRHGTGEDPFKGAQRPVGSIERPEMGRLQGPRGRPFQKGNRAGRKPKLAMLGIDTKFLEIRDERYRSALRRAEFYLKRRSRELAVMFGYASAGVNAMLSSASLQLAASKWLSQKAAEEAGCDMKMFLELSRTAMQLQNAARANELAAYELCAKESAIAKKIIDQAAPWLSSGGDVEKQ